MPTPITRLVFIHEKQAHYPSVKANTQLWHNILRIEERTFAEAQQEDLSTAIAWYMMGFYPHKLAAALTVHDYKSLSLGKIRVVKDWLKALANSTPDLRILKQPMLGWRMPFRRRAPFVLQDIAANDDILAFRAAKANPAPRYTYSYIGAMTTERGFDKVLHSFINNAAASQTLALAGDIEPSLAALAAQDKRITCLGRRPQQDVYRLINDSLTTVCYFPTHKPHSLQTPTKLLEAAALGSRILANPHPVSQRLAKAHGMQVTWQNVPQLFNFTTKQLSNLPDNKGLDPKGLLWSTHVKASGILPALNSLAKAKGYQLPKGLQV